MVSRQNLPIGFQLGSGVPSGLRQLRHACESDAKTTDDAVVHRGIMEWGYKTGVDMIWVAL